MNVNYCRHCGKALFTTNYEISDPDHLSSRGIRDVIIGDGFFMVAIILGLVQSSVNSLLWLLLLIPAFYFFGRGLADVLRARQLRRKDEQQRSIGSPLAAELPPAQPTIADVFHKVASGELEPIPSVTERTTRRL